MSDQSAEVQEQLELDIEAAHRADIISASAEHLAVFLKSLPEGVDNFKLMNVIADFVGPDLGVETMRVLLGVPRPRGTYVLVPMNNRAGSEKIPAIKAIREIVGMGLREAKDCAEGNIGQQMTGVQVIKLTQIVEPLGYKIQRV